MDVGSCQKLRDSRSNLNVLQLAEGVVFLQWFLAKLLLKSNVLYTAYHCDRMQK